MVETVFPLSFGPQLETILKELVFTVSALNLLSTFKGIWSWVLQRTSLFKGLCLNSICIPNFTSEDAALCRRHNVHIWEQFNPAGLALLANRSVNWFMCAVFVPLSYVKCQYFLASLQPGAVTGLALSPALTCKNIKAHYISVSSNKGPVEQERVFSACCEFPCFRLHQLWTWDWSSSSEI